MAIIIDRRKTANRDRTSDNRGRLLRRYKGAIKEQLPKILNDRKLLDNIKGGGGTVVLPKRDLSEPQFVYGDGGLTDTVLPGNDRWSEHDHIDKQKGGSGDQGGTEGDDGMDDFSIILSREEFINLLFEDCELPFMADTLLHKQTEVIHETAGFQVSGSPNRLSVKRSYVNSKARRLSSAVIIDEQIAEAERQLADLFHDDHEGRVRLTTQLEELRLRKTILPLFDTTDLRFRCRIDKTVPKTHATMIMIMDNSGSMGEREKTIARKFFILLYLFLDKNYDQIDLRFVSHTSEAKEMLEKEFFETHENGGTIVSSALDLVVDILDGNDTAGTPEALKGGGSLRGKTNVYVAQVSDGDNTETDNGTCSELLEDDILPDVNYYAYVQVDQEGSSPLNGLLSYAQRNSIWATYERMSKGHKNMEVKKVQHERDIFSVFRSFFSEKL